jgi:hypothetical protein
MWGARQNGRLRRYATSQKVTGSNSDEAIGYIYIFSNLPIPYSCIMVLGSTHPVTEMSTRNPPGGKGWLARKADNLTAISGPIV